MLKLSRYFKI